MVHGGHGHAGGVEPEIGPQQLVDGGKDRDRVLAGGVCGAGWVGLDGGGQSYALVGRLQLAEHAQMIAAKGACAGNDNAQSGLRGYLPCPSTALRQRP